MSNIEQVLINGREVDIAQAEEHVLQCALFHGYDPDEVNAIWSRLTEGDRDDSEDAAAELEAIDLDGSLEFILSDTEF